MTGIIDQWLQLGELAKLFGLSEESIKRVAKNHGFPLRRLTCEGWESRFTRQLF